MKNITFLSCLCLAGILSSSPSYAGDLGWCPETLKGRAIFSKNRPNTVNDTMAGWVGAPASELVATWGAPSSSYDNRDGTRLLTWQREESDCRQSFLVDQQDVVSKWNYKDCNCISGRETLPKETPIPPMTL